MENAKKKIPANVELAGIVSNFMKEKMEQEIKEELASVGKKGLWKERHHVETRYCGIAYIYSIAIPNRVFLMPVHVYRLGWRMVRIRL